MSGLDRGARATLALMALACLAGIGPADARGEAQRERHAERPSGEAPHAARHEAEARQSHRARPARAQAVHATARREPSRTREHPRAADGGLMRDTHGAVIGRLNEAPRSPAASPVRVVRYGNALSGTVERTIRPGFTSRTFVSGGHVLYTHVYQTPCLAPIRTSVRVRDVRACRAIPRRPTTPGRSAHGRARVTYTLGLAGAAVVPDVRRPIHAVSGVHQPGSVDDRLHHCPEHADGLAGADRRAGLRAVTRSRHLRPALRIRARARCRIRSDSIARCASPACTSPGAAAEQLHRPRRSAAAGHHAASQGAAQRPDQSSAAGAASRSSDAGHSDDSEHSAGAQAQSCVLSGRTAARRSVGTANGHCSLSANDYIKRTGGMSNDDWMIPVVVELSRPSDCPEGLSTRIGLNDLNAMENEQEAQVLEAMQAASKKHGTEWTAERPGRTRP